MTVTRETWHQTRVSEVFQFSLFLEVLLCHGASCLAIKIISFLNIYSVLIKITVSAGILKKSLKTIHLHESRCHLKCVMNVRMFVNKKVDYDENLTFSIFQSVNHLKTKIIWIDEISECHANGNHKCLVALKTLTSKHPRKIVSWTKENVQQLKNSNQQYFCITKFTVLWKITLSGAVVICQTQLMLLE